VIEVRSPSTATFFTEAYSPGTNSIMEIKLSVIGRNIRTGVIGDVFVSKGDIVEPGQILLEVNTAVAVIQVLGRHGGTVANVLVKRGDEVKVGQTLLMLENHQPENDKESIHTPREEGEGSGIDLYPSGIEGLDLAQVDPAFSPSGIHESDSGIFLAEGEGSGVDLSSSDIEGSDLE